MLKFAQERTKATSAGDLSGFDGFCSTEEYEEYLRTFDEIKNNDIEYWKNKLQKLH